MLFPLNKNIGKVEFEQKVSWSCKLVLYETKHVTLSYKCYQFSFNPTNCKVCLDPYFLHWEVKGGECPVLQNMIMTSQTTTIPNSTTWEPTDLEGLPWRKILIIVCSFSPALLCKTTQTRRDDFMSTLCARFCSIYPEQAFFGSPCADTLIYPHVITAYHKNKSQEAKQLSQYLAIWLHLL